jgi:hypothetical protein
MTAAAEKVPDGFTPLTVEEAQELMTEAMTGVDRDTLLAERAEADAQVRAAEATLGISNGQEPDEAAQKRNQVDTRHGVDAALDVEELRRAATRARTADDDLARAASEAEPVPGGQHLGTAESAFARAIEVQDELPAAWRRLVGALISATGMAIVIGALGWNVYWLLIPIALIAILTVDLRLSGKAAREASAVAANELAAVGVAGADDLERIRRQRSRMEETESRLGAARAERDAAYARFEELAPGRRPSEVEEVIAEHEEERAARADAEAARMAAEAETVAVQEDEIRVEIEVEPVEIEVEPVEIEVEPVEIEVEAEPAATAAPATPETVTAAEWWFGTKEAPPAPDAASAPVRALAERLSAEGREALARIEAQLAALDRVELAKRSLAWHEANGSGDPSPSKGNAPEKP